jgi:hypothetical protein
MGAADHPGGIQACGKVIVVPIKGDAIKGSQIMFVDARNKTAPNIATLAHLAYQDENLGSLNAAGIAYDEAAKHHWILTTTNPDFGYGNTATLYKTTENMSLFDPRNKLTFVTTISHLLTSQGGTQLLFDTEGKLYVAALYRDNDGKEHVALSSLESPGSNRNAKLLVDKTLSDSGSDIDFSAGFRWGGTIATGPGLSADGKIVSRLEVVGVSRLLTYGPAQQYAKLRIWRQ